MSSASTPNPKHMNSLHKNAKRISPQLIPLRKLCFSGSSIQRKMQSMKMKEMAGQRSTKDPNTTVQIFN
jgi:hypothetical protein